MDYSCTDDTSTTSELAMHLFRMGSGGSSSVVLESENGVETESRKKLPSSKYKGVVPQPNGRWGAQIYEKHQRIWLGTFDQEEEAAASYDIAVRRFRGCEAVTNFTSPVTDDAESAFLEAHSKPEIVDMLRKHTFADELLQSTRKFLTPKRCGLDENNGVLRTVEALFEKSVTPSDVGKLNRLVIPKQHAEKHLPLPSTSPTKGVLINVEDKTGKVWRFRYSYWNSSQSYVLTKGWSRFVKDKNLRPGDVVCLQRSTGPDRQLFIDWKLRSSNNPVQNVVRLFGVNIFNVEPNAVEKRSREDEG